MLLVEYTLRFRSDFLTYLDIFHIFVTKSYNYLETLLLTTWDIFNKHLKHNRNMTYIDSQLFSKHEFKLRKFDFENYLNK